MSRLELSLFPGSVTEAPADTILVLVPEDERPLRGDAGRLRQVLVNLLGNAAKFTDRGHLFVNVAVVDRQELSPGRHLLGVRFEVSDTGPGITAADQEKVFAMFHQLDSSPTRRSGGSGLGLPITAKIIDGHGGRITVASEVGRGTQFTIELPVPPRLAQESTNESPEVIYHEDTKNTKKTDISNPQ